MTSIVWNTKQGRPKGNFPPSAMGKKKYVYEVGEFA